MSGKILRVAVVAMMLMFTGAATAAEPAIAVAEGEKFAPKEGDGAWEVTYQDQSFASCAYGGMWATHGGLIGAPADSKGAAATQIVKIPEDGTYRVWSKYQAPPYFNYLHRIEVRQGGRTVFSHVYGSVEAKKMYSFFAQGVYGLPPKSQVWFPWGMDHDAAEAPEKMVRLKKGEAEVRLVTVKNAEPGGSRFVDFVLLTTNPESTCIHWDDRRRTPSPFIFEALRATPIYMRFKNTADEPARINLNTQVGHIYGNYGGARGNFPGAPVRPGQWSDWFNVNSVVEMLTDESARVRLVGADGKPAEGAEDMPVEVALDPEGRQIRGSVMAPQGAALHFPLDLTWNTDNPLSRVRLSREIAADLVKKARNEWRRATDHKPRYIAFYGAFRANGRPWVNRLKDALGYNTLLPDKYEHLEVDGYHQHLRNPKAIRNYAKKLGAEASDFRVCSFGDEITVRRVPIKGEKQLAAFRAWLKEGGLTRRDLGVPPEEATPDANPRLKWYARLFGAIRGFARYRQMTEVAEQAFGDQVFTGANYSPHHGVMYYGEHMQWITAFKHNAMSMFWTEDYIFTVPVLPQTISFMFARMHCATKYNDQPIHMYVMPHAPGQVPEYFRRNVLFSVGAGARHIDNFWVAPQANFTENYVAWRHPGMFRAIFESIHDTAAAEPLLRGAEPRAARVALVTGKATAINEDHVPADTEADRFLRMCHIAGRAKQSTCRKDQQALHVALRHSQHLVDHITEDDIVQGGVLKRYDAVYFAGEWVNDRAAKKLADWVRAGGTLYASTGLGHRNQFNEKEDALLGLLGVDAGAPEKNLYRPRALLELHIADPIGRIQFGDGTVEAMAFKQVLRPRAEGVKVLGTWADGGAAVTVRNLGKGRAYAVGTAAGLTYLHSGLREIPFARGGYKNLYNPVDFTPAATRLVRLGTATADIPRQAVCSDEHVEALLLDNEKGTLLTLVNWTNRESIDDLKVKVRLPFRLAEVKSVTRAETVDFEWADGTATFSLPLGSGDYVMIMK